MKVVFSSYRLVLLVLLLLVVLGAAKLFLSPEEIERAETIETQPVPNESAPKPRGTSANYVFGEAVTLTSLDASITLSGVLVDIVDDKFVVDVENIGQVQIDAQSVTCVGGGCPTRMRNDTLNFTGSSQLGLAALPHLLIGFGEALEAEPGFRLIDLETFDVSYPETTSGEGFEAHFRPDQAVSALQHLGEGNADFALLPRRIDAQDVDALARAGISDPRGSANEINIAINPIQIIVHPSNPLHGLTPSDLARIYAGDITDWSQLGGGAAPIHVLRPEEGSHLDRMLRRFGIAAPVNANTPVAPDFRLLTEMVETVAINANAIGFSRASKTPEANVKTLSLLDACGQIYDPSPFSIKADEYPLAERLYLYAKPQSATAQDFKEFLTSARMRSAIKTSGFLSPEIERRSLNGSRYLAPLNGQSDGIDIDVLAQLESDFENFERLSTTLRLAGPEQHLPPLGPLISYLSGLAQNATVAVVGFSDAAAAPDENLRASHERAQAVVASLLAHSGERLSHLQIVSKGYGTLAPVACNISEVGRALNNRVEIWVGKSAN